MKLNDFLDAVNLAIDNGEIIGDQEIEIVTPNGPIPLRELNDDDLTKDQFAIVVGEFVVAVQGTTRTSSTC